MINQLPTNGSDDHDWPANYFNYFTEIEEHFQRARGTGLFLLSPVDWALIENWKNSGIPLEAVLKGIDESFEKWRARKIKRRLVNSLAYCSQAVLEAAQRVPSRRSGGSSTELPFALEELRNHLKKGADALRARGLTSLEEIAASLDRVEVDQIKDGALDLEDLERRLSALEDKVVATLRTVQSDETLYSIRQSLDEELRPYRSKMSADQLAMLERRYLESALWERASLPRLSLFYLRPI